MTVSIFSIEYKYLINNILNMSNTKNIDTKTIENLEWYFYMNWELTKDKIVWWVNNWAISLSDIYAIE